ncbi:MAG: hypothetical protein N2439_12375 [Anaerolineae bacterium]|nr:hypothetical protein [Anaerolineae bacterium]
MAAELLNPAQRNSLAIGLRAFEIHLRQIAAWLADGEEAGILYRRRLNLPAERRAALREQIALALAQIAALAERFGLTPAEESLESNMAALMSVDWANLCDLRSDKLRRYGEVDDRLADLLDADIAALAERALALATTCRHTEDV